MSMSMYANSADYWKAQAEKVQREAAEWRQNFEVLQRALVGDTGASGITVAAALRKDAERYRWLRERHEVLCRMYTAQGLGIDLSAVYVRSAEQLDGVIDAAMAPRPVLGAA